MAPVSRPHPRPVQCYLMDEDRVALRRIAAGSDRTMSAYLREIILDHIRSHPDAKPKQSPPRAAVKQR
jgi:hypothetical protein